MKKFFLFIFIIGAIFYVFAEVIGDKLIKKTVESNLTKSLDREVTIDELNVDYLGNTITLSNLEVKNKNFPGNLISLDKGLILINSLSVFDEIFEIDQIILEGIDINYYFNVTQKNRSNFNSLKKRFENRAPAQEKTRQFIIKDLEIKNILVSANTNNIDLSQQVKVGDLKFENLGNSSNSSDYKIILKKTFLRIYNEAKKQFLAGNLDENKIKKKFKEDIIKKNKDKLKEKFKNFIK